MDQIDQPRPSITEVFANSTLAQLIATTQEELAASTHSINELLQEKMSEQPEFAKFVMAEMTEALNPEEAELIGETALITYLVTKTLPIQEELLLQEENPDAEITLFIEQDRQYTQEKIFRKKDNNRIFVDIQDDMSGHPEIALFVTQQMRRSVTVEEANLIGRTALVIYNVLRSLPRK